MLRRGLIRASDALLALAALAAVLALIAPSGALAERSDLVLAALVLFTALGIAPAQLVSLSERNAALVTLIFAPFVVLVPMAWLIGRLFSGPVRDGVLALGVSSTEVAAVGLVALAGGNAVLALGALAGSLVVSALVGPVLLGALAGAASHVAVGELVVRFALVVLLPLACGLLVRARVTRLEHAEGELAGLGTIAVVLLVYAAMRRSAGGRRAAGRAERQRSVPRRQRRAGRGVDGVRALRASLDRSSGHRAARLCRGGRPGGSGVRPGGRDRVWCLRRAHAAAWGRGGARAAGSQRAVDGIACSARGCARSAPNIGRELSVRYPRRPRRQPAVS